MFLEANRRLGNTVACQPDASFYQCVSSEDRESGRLLISLALL